MILKLKELQRKYNLNIKGVIHIGAHHGEEYGIYKEHGIKNMLFFEPNPECFQVTKRNVKGIVINKALGNYTGKVKMYVANNKGMSSSLLKPAVHKKQYPKTLFNKTIEVDIARLDDILENREKYNFINIMAQGYELEVFKGADNVLESIDYIMSGVYIDNVFNDCVQVNELDNFLNNFNRVETSWVGRTWGMAFYIKKND